MTLLSAIPFDWWDGSGNYDTALGYAGVPYGIRDLRTGNELLPWESIAEISAEKCRGHKIIVLRPTPGLQRQLCSIRNLPRHAQNNRIVIRPDGWRPIFMHCCALVATVTMLPARRAPHCSRKMNAALKALPSRLRRTSVIRSPLADRYAATPDGLIPGNARMLRPSDIFWK